VGDRVNQLHRPPVALGHIFGIDSLAANQAGSKLFAQQTKGIVRVLLHGGERDRMGHRHFSDSHALLPSVN
jgi:hypothetical protein